MIYPNQARLSDIVQEAGLKRSGLIASCIFPEVEVPSKAFSWIDWSLDYENLKVTDDTVGCYSQPHRIDPGTFEYINGMTKEHALDMVLKDCGQSACTTDGRLPFNVDAKKTEQLTDRLLINREVSAIAKATDVAEYEEGTDPLTENSDGKVFELSRATIFAPGYDLLGLFQALNLNAYTGVRNTLVLDQATLYQILRHPSVKPAGFNVAPMTTLADIQSLLGFQKVCIADARLNAALPGSPVNLTGIWGSFMFLSRSFDIATPDEATRSFGFSAYTKPLTNRTYFDNKIGSDGGNVQVVSHDFTEVVADRDAATLIELTA